MKHILAVLLLFISVPFALADEPAKRLVQFDKAEVINQAREYLKKAKPDMDPQKFELHSLQYGCQLTPDGYIQQKADGTESFVKTADVTEWLTVTFKVLGSETKAVENGRNCIRHQSLNVTFPHAASPAAGVTDGTITEYRDAAK